MPKREPSGTFQRYLRTALLVVLCLIVAVLVSDLRSPIRPVELMPADQVTNQGRTTPTQSPPVSSASQENAWQLEPNMLSGGWQRVYPNYGGELRALATAGHTLYAVGTGPVLVHGDDESERAWQGIRPAWGDYWGVGLVSAEEGWLIGKSGQLFHFKGNAQERVETPTKDHLWDIQVVASDNAWIVGENGLVLRFDGRNWTQVTVPTTRTIYALNFVTDNEAWAVGRDGLILHLLDGQWSTVTSPTQHHLRGLSMVSASEGWAVGASGTILHFDGQTWENVPSPAAQDLRSVSSPAPGVAWAVGAEGTILRYANAKWSAWPSPTWLWKKQGSGFFGEGDQKSALPILEKADLWRVSMLSPDEGWILGNYTLAHYTHGEWRSVLAPDSINTVDFALDGTGWAMGRGLALHFLNGEWQTFECPTDDRSLSDCGRAMLMADGKLQPVESVGFQVEHLDVLERSDAWATEGSSKVYHFDGVTWQSTKLPMRVWNIQMLTSDDGWIVGSHGYTAHYDGHTWTKVDTPSDRDLYALSMISPNEGWATGAKGIILHYWQGQWQAESSPIGKNIDLLSMASDREGWAVTSNEDVKLLHYQNGVWQAIEAPTHDDITALKMVSDSDGWLLTDRAAVYRYRQGRWTIFVQLPDAHFTSDLAVLPSGEIWIVGTPGEIWHYTPPSP